MASMYTSLFVMMMFVACTLCSPLKRSATDQQDTDCQGTECYFDPDYLNPGIVTVKFPENVTEVVLTVLPLIPEMMGKHEQQIQILTTFVEKMATENLTDKVMAVLPLIPEMMEKHEQQLQNLTTVVEKIATENLTDKVMAMLPLIPEKMGKHEQQLTNLTTVMDNMAQMTSVVAQLLQSQLTILSERLPTPPEHCQDVATRSQASGVYTITPQDGLGSSKVYCDMDTEGGGWTVFQKRFDGSVDFYLGWNNYETGIGSAYGEYWAGLSLIHRLTQSGNWQLRIDLEAFDGDTAYAMYDSFSVGDASSNYRLSVGTYNGTAGDSLTYHNYKAFSTKDRNNGPDHLNYAQQYKGAWWYHGYKSNLNGMYLGPSGNTCCTGNVWIGWKGHKSLKRTEMKMRRVN